MIYIANTVKEYKMSKALRLIFILIIGITLYQIKLAAQENILSNDEAAKKESLKRFIELLDSNDYVVVLIDNKKVRVRVKPVVKEDSDLVWMFVRKKSGQFNYESIHKSLIDYEKTEEYNRMLDGSRKIRQTELARIENQRKKEQDEELLKKGLLPDKNGQAAKVFTQHDLSKKTVVTKAIYINDIVNLEEIEGWNIIIVTENENYNDIIFSLDKGNGEVIFTTTIKDLLSVRDELKTQMEAYKAKVQEYYDSGTAEGDKYKYSGKIVEVQILLQDYEKKMNSIQKIIAKLPPKPEENPEKKTE
jgi:hypothetical protein